MDIGIELLQKVTESFQKAYNEDVSIKVLEKRLKANKAHYEDAARYSERVGELLAEAYSKVVTSEALPGGVMTWEIAQEVIQKPLIENYRRAATASVDYIAAENKRRGIGLKAQKPRPDFERLDGIKRKLVDAEKFDDVAFMLDRPVVNFTRAVLDDAVEVNADFQAKAGLDVKIVRTTTGRETCDWCKRLAGTYDYEDVRHGHDVWKRHLDCDCKIEHVSAKGREVVQNYKRSNREQIEARKQLEAPNDRAPEKIEARKQVFGVGERVIDSENSQAYRPVEYGVVSKYKRGMVAIKGRALLNTRHNIWVSNEVHVTRRKQHELDKALDEAYGLLQDVREEWIKPNVLVLSDREMQTMAKASYNAVKNELVINEPLMGDGNRLETLVHELIHWQDAQEHKGEITAENFRAGYLEPLRKKCKKALDRAGITADNVSSISEYAKESYKEDKFDEAYTEYRVKKLLKGGQKK